MIIDVAPKTKVIEFVVAPEECTAIVPAVEELSDVRGIQAMLKALDTERQRTEAWKARAMQAEEESRRGLARERDLAARVTALEAELEEAVRHREMFRADAAYQQGRVDAMRSQAAPAPQCQASRQCGAVYATGWWGIV